MNHRIKDTKISNQKFNQQNYIRTYSSIFQEVLHKRMKFYNRLSAIIALLFAIILSFLSQSKIIFLPVKFIVLFVGYFILQKSRLMSITTTSLKYSNKFQKIISIICSKNFYVLTQSYIFNSILISSIIYFQSDSSLNYYISTPTKTIKPFINDGFSFFCFFTLISPIFYSLNFVLTEKNILHIPMGTYRQEPIDYFKKLPHLKILILSLLKSLISILTIPLIYQLFFREIFFKTFLKPLVLINDLNYQLPRSDFNFNIYFKLSFILIIQFLIYDLLNEIFNAYASIGCLVVKKPISYFSKTPFKTLLSGLKEYKNSLVQLTAYQELVYLSTSLDFKDREIFYRADNWNLILAEFYFNLTNAARSAKSDLPKTESNVNLNNEIIKNQINLFGNLNNSNNVENYNNNLNLNLNLNFDLNNDGNNNNNNLNSNEENITIIKHDVNESVFKKPETKEDKISDIENKYNDLTLQLTSTIEKTIKKVNDFINSNLSGITNTNKDSSDLSNKDSIIYQLKLIYIDLINFTKLIFIGDIFDQSNKRIPNKEIIGFSIIALTEILINAKIEDKHNTVLNTLTESLTLLTKVYKGTSEFLNNPPTDILNNKKQSSIFILNELSINYFFKLVVYYNDILNDLLLPPEVFKLAKWCTDMALEQQREQKITANILS